MLKKGPPEKKKRHKKEKDINDPVILRFLNERFLTYFFLNIFHHKT